MYFEYIEDNTIKMNEYILMWKLLDSYKINPFKGKKFLALIISFLDCAVAALIS